MNKIFYIFFIYFLFNFAYSNTEDLVCENVSYARAVEKTVHAVVSIQTVQEIHYTPHPSFDDPVFKFFFGDIQHDNEDQKNVPQNKQFQQGLGSGVIVDKRGYILTNNHVIKDSNTIYVKLSNGSSSIVEIIGNDTRTDLAILRIKKKELLDNLPVISLGNSDHLKVGDVVLAIGNPFGFDNTVTQGIVSGLGSVSARSNEQQVSFGGWLDNLIQTDAAINPGNSGGALIDVHGNLVGINLAIISRSGGSQGIGFAIPINLAKDVMEQLIKTGHIVRGWIGTQLHDLNPELKSYLGYNDDHGVYVQGVIRNSPAERAGILPGDIIVKINDIDVKSVNEAVKLVGSLQPNKSYTVEIFRKFKFYSFSVLISQIPKDQ